MLKKFYWSFDVDSSHCTNTIGCYCYYLKPTIRVKNDSDLKLVYNTKLSKKVALASQLVTSY